MRAGGCTVQHALTAEAAGVVKQAVVLAKRRGHAQVTPLHVANTMLAASGGLFRVACMKSNSHPLQCKALELCFNVALNRLPATTSSAAILGPHHHFPNPSISNALVAAFKRAQAHQRRGSVDAQQQQPVLSVKIELEQLIISILDDPSVSRVMCEAGFSSTQVKSNVEKEVSLELSTHSSSPETCRRNEEKHSFSAANSEAIRVEDVDIIVETLLTCGRRKSLAIVGESISNLQTTVKGLMERINKGNVPDGLKEVKFISIPPLYSFCNLRSEEVEQKIGELTFLVKSLVEKGVVLYLGDLKWISDYRVGLEQERGYYCSVEHMIMEIGKLVWGIGESGRFWLMGIATFQSYMRCRSGCSQSLETVWGLHPVTIPANSLGLSLASDSERNKEHRSSQVMGADCREAKQSCCGDYPGEFEADGQNLMQTNNGATLPSWLKDECSRRSSVNNDQNGESDRELCNKWNTFCSSAHKLHQPGSIPGTLTLSSSSPKYRQNPNLTSNPNSAPNSTSSSDVIMEIEYAPKFKEFNAENLNILCHELEKKTPSWDKELVQEIAGTVLKCRSGMLRRKQPPIITKEETWLFFLGHDDAQAKEKLSKELAKIVFGSYSSFVSIGSSSFSSSDECRRKRGRDEQSCIDRLGKAVSANPHRVFFMEDFDQTDYGSKLGIHRAIERGRIRIGDDGEEIGFGDAIIVLSCDEFRSRAPPCSPRIINGVAGAGEDETSAAGHCEPLDLNVSFDDETCGDRTVDDLGILESFDCIIVFKAHM